MLGQTLSLTLNMFPSHSWWHHSSPSHPSSPHIPLLVTQGNRGEKNQERRDSIPIGCSYALCSSLFFLALPPHPSPPFILAPLQHRHHLAWCSAVRDSCLVRSWSQALPRGLKDSCFIFLLSVLHLIKLCHKLLTCTEFYSLCCWELHF